MKRTLFAALLWLAAHPALGQAVHFSAPAAGARLEAGSRVTLRWSRIPASVRELEVLLALDGGARRVRRVRLTGEIDPQTREITWRVPNLLASAARLELRADVDGRETVIARSERFAIGAAGARTTAPSGSIRTVRGELWWLDGSVSPLVGAGPVMPELEPESDAALLPTSDGSAAAMLESPAGASRPATSGPAASAPGAQAHTPSRPQPFERTPLAPPLRI